MIIKITFVVAFTILLLLSIGYLLYVQENNDNFLNRLSNWEYVVFTPIAVICYIVNSFRLKNWFTIRDNFPLLYLIMLLLMFAMYKGGWIIYKKKFIDGYDIPNYYEKRFLGGFALICIFIPIFGLYMIISTIFH